MNKKWWAAIVPGILALVVGAFVLALLLVKLLWAWTIPDLFPGAVEQGLIAGSISWFTAFKVAIFVAVFAGLAGVRRGKESQLGHKRHMRPALGLTSFGQVLRTSQTHRTPAKIAWRS